jgi:hypothetical protein
MSVAEAGTAIASIVKPAAKQWKKRDITSPRSSIRATIVQGFFENCDAFINSNGGVIVMPAQLTYSSICTTSKRFSTMRRG